MQALQNKLLGALDSNTNALKSVGYQRQSSFLDERAADPPVTLKDDRGKTFAVDNDLIDISLLLCEQTNEQFEIISVDPNSNKFNKNGMDESLVPNGIKMKGKVYDFPKGSDVSITNKNVAERDIKGDKDKKQFLRDIGHKQRGDTKSNRSNFLRRFLASIVTPTSQTS